MKKKLVTAGIAGGLFLLLILLLCTVDVRAIGPANTSVGLAALNGGIHKGIGTHSFWYTVSKIFGLFAIAAAGGFAVIGILQLVRGKSLKRVDPEILLLGCLYLVTILFYLFFNLVSVNARPVLSGNETVPEASFPSSHTLLVLVVMLSAIKLLNQYMRNPQTRRILQLGCWAVIFLCVLGRLLSGVHWFTDIIGAILLGICLYNLFAAGLIYLRRLRAEDRLPYFEKMAQ